MFARRNYNIHSLAVGPTDDPRVSRLTLVVGTEAVQLEQIVKQLNKLVHVLKIVELDADESVVREMQLVKVAADRTTAARSSNSPTCSAPRSSTSTTTRSRSRRPGTRTSSRRWSTCSSPTASARWCAAARSRSPAAPAVDHRRLEGADATGRLTGGALRGRPLRCGAVRHRDPTARHIRRLPRRRPAGTAAARPRPVPGPPAGARGAGPRARRPPRPVSRSRWPTRSWRCSARCSAPTTHCTFVVSGTGSAGMETAVVNLRRARRHRHRRRQRRVRRPDRRHGPSAPAPRSCALEERWGRSIPPERVAEAARQAHPGAKARRARPRRDLHRRPPAARGGRRAAARHRHAVPRRRRDQPRGRAARGRRLGHRRRLLRHPEVPVGRRPGWRRSRFSPKAERGHDQRAETTVRSWYLDVAGVYRWWGADTATTTPTPVTP